MNAHRSSREAREARGVAVVFFGLVGAAACSSGSTILVRNPLSAGDAGTTLSAKRPPKSDTFQLAEDMLVRPDACAAPVDDAIQLAVSKDEVCVRTARSEVLTPGGDAASLGARADAVTLGNDDGTRTLALPATGAPTEITTCTASNGAVVHVLRVEHRACVRNDGLVTPWTRSLVFDAGAVDEVRWDFDDGQSRGDHV